MKGKISVRFAPSLTGLFHIGNARTALYNKLFELKHNRVFILSTEDTGLVGVILHQKRQSKMICAGWD